MGSSRFWLKVADEESKNIPHGFPRSHWLKATGQCVIERYLPATMAETAVWPNFFLMNVFFALNFSLLLKWLCVIAVTGPDSAESTEITELPGPNLRKMANNYDLPMPVFSSVTGWI